MKKNLCLFLCCMLYGGVSMAQQAGFPRDTSYTVGSTLEKIKKDYPFIKPVLPQLPAGVTRKEHLVYRTVGNRALHLDVFYPTKKSEKGYPGVVLIHGGGWRSGDKKMEWPMAQQLAAQGYVAATVEYRLSLEAPYPAAVHDLKAAVRWMRAHAREFQLDTSNIAAYGTSAGGQLAALLGTTGGSERLEGQGAYRSRSSEIQAIVDIDGILAFKHPESKEGAVAAQWLGGTAQEAPEVWAEASALTHTGKNTPPVLFVGSSQTRFLAGKMDMIRVLDKEGIYHESYSIPNTPHTFWLFEPWFAPTLQYTVNFLNTVFKGKPKTTRDKKRVK
jgi:acetyl esterase/lipase